MAERPRSARDRPLGLAPVGTSATFAFGLLYPFFTVTFTAFALVPWLADGTDADVLRWCERCGYLAVAAAVLTVLLSIPYVILYLARRYAAVCVFFTLGLLSAIIVPVAVAAVAILLIESWRHPPDLVIFAYMFGACLLAMLATWPWLVRGLRLTYWQPWTMPDQWEVGDERLAGWAQGVTGVADRRPATDGSRPPRRRH